MRRVRLHLVEHLRLWMKHPAARLGRRGAVLLMLGVIWFFIGIGTITDPYGPDGNRNMGLFHEVLPSWLRAILWMGTALAALSAAWRPAGRRDDWGYMALILMPIIRTASYTWAWLTNMFGGHGDPTGWLGAIVWGTVAVLVFTISGWPETPSFILPIEGQEPDAVE